jgi:hypothetical protein
MNEVPARRGVTLVTLLMTMGCAASAAPVGSAPDFNRDIRPILFNKCIACHGPDEHERKAGLRLDRPEGAVAPLKKGGQAIVAGERSRSKLWGRITAKDPDEMMPPPESGQTLKPEQIELLGKWIDAGAKYDGHWAFKKPESPRVPAGVNPIDYFISERLAREGLTLSREADAASLVRRLFLDLTGLPPTPAEVDAFVRSSSVPAEESARNRASGIEALVDTLLASPAFGERWARMWLDLARYADSRGYGSDPLRLNIWRYRDWVIDAFNRNLPYDRFTIEQLAGDLLPDPTPDQLLATAFHRNTLTNTLGGTIDEEFRVVAVKDRAETTAQVWMGLTLRCAQCHTHKFDPITNDEYYQFYAIFNQTEDSDRPDEYPLAPTPTRQEQETIDALKRQIAAAKTTLGQPSAEFLSRQADWEAAMRNPDSSWRPLEVTQAVARSGASLQKQPDGSIFVGPPAAEDDRYTMEAPVPFAAVTGVRIEALPDDRLPGGGPGLGENGNFVVNEIKIFERPRDSVPASGRFVRIELPGDQKLLHIAEVQVVSATKNIAPAGKARQSSIDYGGTPERAIDGRTDGNFSANSTIHTKMEKNPWWEVDLGSNQPVEQIVVWNRTDSKLEDRLDGYVVKLLDAERREVFSQMPGSVPRPSQTVAVDRRREVTVRTASATFEQEKFPAAAVIDGNPGRESGWAVAPRTGKAQTIVLELADPLCVGGGCTMSIEISHQYARQLLGRFRLSATNQSGPLRALPESLAAVIPKTPETRTAEERSQVREFYAKLDPAAHEAARHVAQLEKQLADLKPTQSPVMRELPKDKRRLTKTMVKGNYLATGHEVSAGVPAAFHPLEDDIKREAGGEVNRLALANWLVSRDNPLTARVAVNRFWSQLFGRGLVVSEEDFGTQGTYPTHPDLLDWLAVDFMNGGWDVKRLLKTIVMSRTYRQASEVSEDALQKDPQNLLLSRGPRFRLDAEMVRDQALAISGLLSRKMLGPSVYPPQPDGLWRAAFNGERSYPTSTGADRYRRGIYVFVRRTVPYPSLMTFDAPNREICTMRRLRTNTPLQAFVTLNDPAFVEMAQSFARRMIKEGGQNLEDRLRFAYRLCVLRDPPPDKLQTLVDLFQSELAKYRTDIDAAKKLASDPLHPLPDQTDWSELAAYTVIANTLLNLDAVMMKG